MTRRQSNNQWSGGIVAHPSSKYSSAKIRCKISRLDFLGSRRLPAYWLSSKGPNSQREYYSSLLVQLKDILKEKRRGKFTKVVFFFHDNVPAHRALATQKKLAYLGFCFLHHPPYSPDLAPSNYHLFLGLKKKLKVRHFSSDAEVTVSAETCLDGQTSDFFLSGFEKLEQRAKRCRGEYVE